VNAHTLNRIVLALTSSVLFVAMSLPANGQQPSQQQAFQPQKVASDRLARQPQLTSDRPPEDQGQRAKPRNSFWKKSRFLILKSLEGHVKPLNQVPA
jgi:hypothetical protein